MQERWEYTIQRREFPAFSEQADADAALIAWLNELGDQGWVVEYGSSMADKSVVRCRRLKQPEP